MLETALQALSYCLLNEVHCPSALHQVMSYHYAYHKNELQFLNYRELGRIFNDVHSLVQTEFVVHTDKVCLTGSTFCILSGFLLLPVCMVSVMSKLKYLQLIYAYSLCSLWICLLRIIFCERSLLLRLQTRNSGICNTLEMSM